MKVILYIIFGLMAISFFTTIFVIMFARFYKSKKYICMLKCYEYSNGEPVINTAASAKLVVSGSESSVESIVMTYSDTSRGNYERFGEYTTIMTVAVDKKEAVGKVCQLLGVKGARCLVDRLKTKFDTSNPVAEFESWLYSNKIEYTSKLV